MFSKSHVLVRFKTHSHSATMSIFLLDASNGFYGNKQIHSQGYLGQQLLPGWPHSSQNEIPCVFPEFSLCYINFPCVIFTQKLTISSMNKGMSLLNYYIQKYTNSFFKVGIILSVSIVNFSKCFLIEGSGESCDTIMIRGLGHRKSVVLKSYFVDHILLKF